MKKSLVLAFLMVSVTAFAGTVEHTYTIKCGATEAEGNLGETENSSVFSGNVELTTQADEVVFADAMLSMQKGAKAQPELLTLVDMHGTQDRYNSDGDETKDSDVTSIGLLIDEDTEDKAYLVINLGETGSNSRLTYKNAIYSARCEKVQSN